MLNANQGEPIPRHCLHPYTEDTEQTAPLASSNLRDTDASIDSSFFKINIDHFQGFDLLTGNRAKPKTYLVIILLRFLSFQNRCVMFCKRLQM